MKLEEMQALSDFEQEALFSKLDTIRSQAKTVNYASLYLVGANTLSKQMGISKRVAQKMLDAYWERNWAVKSFSQSCVTRVIDGETWVLNPIANVWLNLRSEKDIFSTVNQSSGVFIFDLFVFFIIQQGEKVIADFHDEVVIETDNEQRTRDAVKLAMKKVNEFLKLKVEIECSMDFGANYYEVH
jgi:DNA polymerase I-like protein with 3'-5' exonuclease and polymerase domains